MKRTHRMVGMSLLMASLVSLSACGASMPAEATASASTEDGQNEAVEASGAETTAATEETASSEAEEPTEIQVFIAASLNAVMQDLAKQYQTLHPEVTITFNADSSGKLLTQIEEGYACDVFFSASQKQMNTLDEEDQLIVNGTRKNVVNNQVCVITTKNSGTKVTGLENIAEASSIALADGSVPVGKYTRQAMVSIGLLPEAEDVSKITTEEVSEALGGVEISEQSNVSKVLAAVTEGACEVGTTYYSDTYGHEDQVEILEKIPYELTGNVIYPIAEVKNDEADEAEQAAARDFIDFVTSEDAKTVFQQYYFDTDVK